MTLSPPYIELAFWIRSGAEVASVGSVFDLMASVGAAQEGVVEYNLHSKSYATNKCALHQVIAEVETFESIRVHFRSAPKIEVDRAQVELDRGILVYRTEGDVFCGHSRDDRKALRSAGLKAYRLFLQLAQAMGPVYGAICVEYALERPEELRRDERSLAFRNFFINVDVLGESFVSEAMKATGDDVYIEQTGRGGLYVSMSAEFNPNRKAIDAVRAQYRSIKVARILAATLTP